MKLHKPAALAAALALAATPVTAQQPNSVEDFFNSFERLLVQYQILVARSFVDLTYESLTIEPRTGNLILSDVIVYPELPWDQDFACEVLIDRAVIAGVTNFETLSSTIEVAGLTMPAACLPPDVGGMLPAFGYTDGLTAEAVSIDIAYDLPSSAADINVIAAIEDAADLTISAGFNYLWFRLPMDGGGDPTPVAFLGSAEVTLENRGLWERLEPMVGQQVGDVNQLPGMIQGMLGQMLGGTPEGQAFVQNLATEVGRFVQDKDRLVITAAPEGGVYLGPDTFGSPDDIIAILQPQVSGAPAAYRAIVSPADLAAALQGGAGMDDATKLSVGRALMTGVGAPRSLSDGEALLTPLVEAWNAEAALIMADALSQAGPSLEAYAAAMVATAGGESRAIGIADRLEADMRTQEILDAQEGIGEQWPELESYRAEIMAAIEAGDVSAIRKAAHAAAVGRGVPRSYMVAYLLSSLASAAGDQGAANLRKRLDQRFGGDAVWRTAADEAASEALAIWTEGMGAAIAARVR
ncbi:MAG: hypothetical protein AAGK00_01460 [Pseudomonadota bacterium]